MVSPSVVATKSFTDSGGITLIVSGKGAPLGHRYAITITEGGADDEYELTHVEGGARLFLLSR